MDEFFKSVTSQSWWFSVVLVGVLVNFLSTYLLKRLERAGVSLTQWRRNRTERKRENFRRHVDYLVGLPARVQDAYAEESRWRARSNRDLLIALLCWVAAMAVGQITAYGWISGLLAVLSTLPFFHAMQIDDRADQIAEAIDSARHLLEQRGASGAQGD